MNKSRIAILGVLALAGANAMACYTVYDGRDRVLYRGTDAPVDMSMQLHEALATRGYPAGARMVFNEATACAPVAIAQVARPASNDVPPNTLRLERSQRAQRLQRASTAQAPLFTDRATALESRLPHTQVAGDIVMVPPSAAGRAIRPTVTVLPTTAVAAAAPVAPDTTTLGAGRAMQLPAPASATAAPGFPAANVTIGRRQTVITELRDPPVTIVNNGGNITVTPN